MDPFTILIWTAVWAGVSAGIYATVYFANLTAQIIYEWFRKFAYLLVENDRRYFQNREYVAFTVQQAMATGDYNVVEGIFDNKNQKIYDARVIRSDSVDTTIKQAHSYGRKEVAFWQ
ncbi:MAG: hypothetical protein ACM65M_04580 [Microcoleus sp.]